jgi:exodeoxyribonuclease V
VKLLGFNAPGAACRGPTRQDPKGPRWADQQREAIAAILSWLERRDRPYFYLAGYAGTGKTTLAAHIGRQLAGTVIFGAYTGKAADVMRKKGCADAATLDSLIYRPRVQVTCTATPPCSSPPCSERCRYQRERYVGRELNKDGPLVGAKLCVVDEASMIGEQLGRDLLSFGVPVFTLGDMAQLPPVGDAGFFTRRAPDFELTQVHRQALASPVIQLATRARQGLPLRLGEYGDSAVVSGADICTKELLNFDQVICGTHHTRNALNKEIRRELGYGGLTPERGEKVLCLKNNRGKGLRNGTLWTVIEALRTRDGYVEMEVESEDGFKVDVVAPVEGFTAWDGSGADLPMQPFAFGYCITCHKAQGSQWDSILVIDESGVFRQHRWRWLYTAITRAVERVVVVPRSASRLPFLGKRVVHFPNAFPWARTARSSPMVPRAEWWEGQRFGLSSMASLR